MHIARITNIRQFPARSLPQIPNSYNQNHPLPVKNGYGTTTPHPNHKRNNLPRQRRTTYVR
ncbi:hypothetical protein, partial [Microseira sp. BLCC-F43]|uniref:hypothetical protein n=1 Tax=Microseira sp. BLCC-F43 TaxID=3153602 RepID=UPI0035B822F0